MKIKVLHVVLSMETGGLENGIVNLVNHSDSSQFQVDILCLRARGELADRITAPNGTVYFDGNEDHSIITAIKKILTLCKANDYHILHAHGFTTMLASYVAGKLAGTAVIMNGEHGTYYDGTLRQRLLQKFLFARMDINLSVCAELKDRLINAFSIKKDNFKPILNGVNTDKFHPSANTVEIRKELQLENDAIIIGSVARLVPGKDFPSLIRSINELKNKHPKVHLLIVGDGPERETLESLIQQLSLESYVTLLGRRDDVPYCLQAMDIFCLPSLSEGLSNTILEAMACGLPTVACNVGGNPEIVFEGKTGYLVSPQSPNELAAAFSKLLQSPETLNTFKKNALQHILKAHSLEAMVKQYEDTYIELMERRGLSHIATQPAN